MIPLGDSPKKKRDSFITPLLIAGNVLFFLYMLLFFPDASAFYKVYGLNPAQITRAFQASSAFQPVYWTFLSSMFSHGGWWHLISNMLFLWIFGDNVEDRMGKFFFLIFYLLAGTGAAIVQILLQPDSNVVMVGASGAISAVMGAYLVLYPKASVMTLVPILFFPVILRIPTVVFMAFWFLTQILNMATGTSGVGWGAHVGGFMIGLLLGWMLIPLNRPPSARVIEEDRYFR
ncbi:rhomboid family intramembrane serine protease [bacterium]|nr:rhomboid family intramembrane serine protease [bacterium]